MLEPGKDDEIGATGQRITLSAAESVRRTGKAESFGVEFDSTAERFREVCVAARQSGASIAARSAWRIFDFNGRRHGGY